MSLQVKDLTPLELDDFNERLAIMVHDGGCKEFFASAYILGKIEEARG